jgi:hypothetical protein
LAGELIGDVSDPLEREVAQLGDLAPLREEVILLLGGQGSKRPPDPERVVKVVPGGGALDHGRFPSR